ncbi:hypothetical protein L5515_010977 [Caenorhabditis briggsae]|uniref:MIF4G domain-containing protein n=1 Tax=Caenorhabditis briggsae TaxID=6238 RepID=A0AAE9ENL7_CAEBR|nr:hypothetical protein L5515_010977 [Caenorhabditis briggsae]
MPYTVEKSWLEELQKRVEFQETSRLKMVEVRENFLDNEKELRSLDSALKKTTSFMKKIKLLSAATVPQLIEELSKLNLSKFVEEIASGIIETKLKISDIPKVTELCLAVSAMYSNFSEQMAGEFKKILPVKKTDKITNVAKLRVDIIFLAELCLCGVFNEKEGLQVLGAVLTYLIQTDKIDFVNYGLLATVSRCVGWQIANIIPIPFGDDNETVKIEETDLPTSSALSGDQKKSIRELFKVYYDVLYAKTEKICSARNKAMKKVKRQERSRGDAADEEKAKFNELQAELDTLRKMTNELSCAIGITMKPLKEEASDDEEDEAANLEMGRQLAEGAIKLWSDEETKAFYADLIDLRLMVPKDLYKESEQRTLSKAKMAERIEDIDVENINESGAVDAKRTMSRANSEKESTPEESEAAVPTKEDISEDRGVNKWQKFVLDLDHLVSKYSTDKAAEYFVSNLNNKGCRKRLVKLMVEPPPTRIDVVPFYARLIATLENVMPDLTTEIVTQLLDKFRGFLQQKPSSSSAIAIKVVAKMVCVMMIAELMKFGVISRPEGLSCLRQLVYDLRGHSVEMTATFMESGGLYLYRHTESHAKMKRLLEVVKAKRERMKDQRQAMLIDNAYFTCLPPEDSKEERLRLKFDEEDTPMKKFIRHVVLDINDTNVDNHLKCLRRLDWSDPEISDYTIRYLSSTWLLPIENLQHLASAIAGLCNLQHLQWIGMAVIDSTIQTIRISLENPGNFNQWAHSAAVYLAELYSFELCDEDLIIQILYQLISYPEPENSWKDLHRIRMICAVLEIVREFIQKGPGRLKLRYFMAYFHRYYFTKKEAWDLETQDKQPNSDGGDNNETVPDMETSFPYEVEIAYSEMCRKFRGKKKNIPNRWPKNLKEAQDAVAKVEKKFKGDLKEVAGEHSDIDDGGMKDLNVIEEDDEDEDDDNKYSEGEQEFEDSDEERQRGLSMSNAVTKEEDDDFQRELERMMGEGFRQSAFQAPAAAVQYDVTLPAAAKNRFSRNIKFAEDTKARSSPSRSSEMDFDDEPSSSTGVAASGRQKQGRVTLMVRGKANKPALKTVNIDDGELQRRWKEEKAREEEERADMKRLTLGQHRRIEMEEEKALLAQLHGSRKNNAKKNPPRLQFPKPHLEGEW